MEPEGSLPHSKLPATCLYPEPARSNKCPHVFLKKHLNIILSSTPGFSKWSLSLKFPHQNPVYTSTLSHTRYMPSPSHSSQFYHPQNTLSSSLSSFLHSLVSSCLLSPNILLNTLFSNTLSLRSSLSVSDQVSHPHISANKIIFLYSSIFK